MPEIQNSSAPVECKVGDYLNSPFHQSVSAPADANTLKEINKDVSIIKETALSAMHADSLPLLSQGENKLLDELVQLDRNPKLENAVVDKLATPDASHGLPVADIVLRDKKL